MTEKEIERKFNLNGYIKFKLVKNDIFELRKKLYSLIKKKVKLKKFNLKKFHKQIPLDELNSFRLYLYNEINRNNKFSDLIYNSSKIFIEKFAGNELAKSSINLSIQYPKDDTSLLHMHTDFFSGESLFQVNLWIPFVDVEKTGSIFIIKPEKSLEILQNIKNSKNMDFKKVEKKYIKDLKFIKVKFGEGILFSPNCLHGNVINETNNARWSINIRYKNLFSPYSELKENEKKIGIFYDIFTAKLITKFNLKYDFKQITR